ncbi:MAG TPA: HAD family hydrolase [Pseudonocardiaceae bacterium]
MIDAVIFDWGGTLTPWHQVDHLAGWHAYASVLHPGDPVAAGELAGTLLAAERLRWDIARDEHRAFSTRQVLDDAGTPWDDEAAAAYREFWAPHTLTDPEVGPMLAALRLRGLRVGVLSSTPWPAEWHHEFLRRDGVFDALHGSVWSSSLEWTKPHAEAFGAAMRAVQVEDPRRCVYVGDRVYDDVHGAQSVGMRTILVPHSVIPDHETVPVEATPDAVVQRIGEVVEVVDGWIGSPR